MKIIEDFITEDEQHALLAWVDSRTIPVLRPRNQIKHPVNSKFPNSEWIVDNGPQAYYDIQSRIKEQFNWTEPTKGRKGKIFIHHPNCRTPEHIDHYDTARVTAMIQNADDGGRLVHGGDVAEIPERGIAVFDATIPHEVNQVISGKRIVFVFEFNA